jgi:hypothetical protein
MKDKETRTIHPLHTSCGDCIFSEKDKRTQTQIGCSFNKIESYKSKGDSDVIEAYDKFGNEFFVINNHVCLHKRTKEWAKDYTKNQWKPMVEEQLKIKYHAMVMFRENDTIEGLLGTIGSLNSQRTPPCLLTIINRSKLVPTELIKEIEGEPDPKSLWRLQTFFDNDLTDRGAIDIVIDSSKYISYPMFYIVFESPLRVPSVFSDEVQSYFVDEMKHAIFAYPRKDGNGLLVNSMFHKKHAGNCFGIHIEDKLKEFEPGAEQYFKNIEEICPSLKM